MLEHKINQLDNFICGWYINDVSVCDEIIDLFNTIPSKAKSKGTIGSGNINEEFKKSLDYRFSFHDPLLNYYVQEISPMFEEYKKKYEWCDSFAKWGFVQSPQIQYYSPGDAFYGWHSERISAKLPQANRHLVFMTYLNDVTDGGETEFFYQKIKVKPEKGLTLIWPVDWTFTHRGITSPTQEKYIITGWLNYVE